MKLVRNPIAYLALAFLLITLDSCQCNKPADEAQCPTCEIYGQYCENLICRCPDGEEVVGLACRKIDRLSEKEVYWKPLSSNGNCFDSVLCSWYLISDTIPPGGPVSVGGNAYLSFVYFGQDSDTHFERHNDANLVKDSTGYKLTSFVVCNMPCIGAVNTRGYTNATLDTLWCHYKIVECYDPWANHGEFDQVYVRY